MDDLSDKGMATSLLEARREGGYTKSYFFRKTWKHYTIFFGGITLVLTFLAYRGIWIPFSFILGFASGILIRDRSWLHATRTQFRLQWPFVVKVTDWEKVERLANDQSA